jgi:hypothetical protein
MMDRAWPLLAAILIGVALPAAAQPPQSAQQNVRESEEYSRLLCTNPAFRAHRIAVECGPLQGSEFYSSCVASFTCNGPARRMRMGPPPSETTR